MVAPQLQSVNGDLPDLPEPTHTTAEDILNATQDAEQSLLGAILGNPYVIHDLKTWIEPHNFLFVIHKWIYEAILSIENRREDFDLTVVSNEIQVRHQLEEVGGYHYLMSMVNHTDLFYNASAYARAVKEFWRRREFLAIASQMAQKAVAFDGNDSAETKRLIAEAQKLINEPYNPTTDGLRQYLYLAKDLEQLPDLVWLIPGELPANGLTIIYGPSGVGKSFFALDYAARISLTDRVLYVAAEGESGFKKRIRAWLMHNQREPEDLKLYFYLNVALLLDDNERGAFIAQILDYVKPRLLILDTVAHCMLPGDENSTRDMGLFLKAAKEIRQHDKAHESSMVLVHHTNKEGRDERGSTALRGAADSMIRLIADDDVITVECAKSKDMAPFPTRYIRLLPVQVGDEEYAPVIIEAEKVQRTQEDPLSNQQRHVLQTIVDIFENGAEVQDLLDQLRVGKGSLQKSLSTLRKLNFVEQEAPRMPYKITAEGIKALNTMKLSEKAKTPSTE